MKQAKPRTEAQQKAYLQRALKMNPVTEAEQFVSLRNRFHRLEDKRSDSQSDQIDGYEQREAIAASIAQMRVSFWQTDLEEMKRSLQALSLDHYPDLKNAAERLLILAENRHKFAQLAANKNFNRGLLNSLKEILPLSQKDAAAPKDALLQKVTDPTRSKQVRRSLKVLEQQAPEIYQLEIEWFDTLRKVKPFKGAEQVASSGSSSDGESSGWVIWIAIIIIANIVRALLRG